MFATAAHAATYRVPTPFADGFLNVRAGPGTNHALRGAIPAGAFVEVNDAACQRRDDRIPGSDFCPVNYRGVVGWASRAGLMPIEPAVMAQPALVYAKPELHGDLVCDPPVVLLGDTAGDTDPVVGVEVSYDASVHGWQIFHHHASGLVASRSQQYAIEDFSNGNETRWGGSLNRNRSLYMIGKAAVNYSTGEGYYEEWLYNRSQGNRLDVHLRAICRLGHPVQQAQPVWTRPQPQPEPTPAPPPPGPTGPNGGVVTQQGPVQQNGPIVTPPSTNNNSFTIIIPREIPGTSYAPKPKDEPEKGS
jgi:hypothetical protein